MATLVLVRIVLIINFTLLGVIYSTEYNIPVDGQTPAIQIGYNSSADIGILNTWSSKPLRIEAYNDVTVRTTGTDRLIVKGTSGNVGIGTTTPGSPLEVNGTVRLASIQSTNFTAGVSGFSIESGDASYTTYRFDSNKFRFYSGNYGEIVSLNENGSLGIGTTSPGQKLDVTGNIRGNNLYANHSSVPSLYMERGRWFCLRR